MFCEGATALTPGGPWPLEPPLIQTADFVYTQRSFHRYQNCTDGVYALFCNEKNAETTCIQNCLKIVTLTEYQDFM